MSFNELGVLRWLHIIAMVYWLGGEWGVFQTSYNVINRKLTLEERRRHMETAYRIDILARSGIILLLPLGLHMGYLWGIQPWGGHALVLMWLAFAAWLGLAWAAFIYRETDRGVRLTRIDEQIRYVVIPLLLVSSLASLLGYGPFSNEPGQNQAWYSAKVLIYALLLVIGLKLRFIMREWTMLFRRLAAEGNPPEIEAVLERSIRIGRGLAYLYWIGIGSVAFLAAVKPF
ncbi:hypothetical protein BURK2_03310 [Burkholderiales bacterium]|nr:MAG: hypothetical protein F9K47_04580 [Burkholderiales bacterium]CAG1004674.1 hypothetical protein BURK2_03310 [Burkholderiales bacterium]